jgi:hypothetical protein
MPHTMSPGAPAGFQPSTPPTRGGPVKSLDTRSAAQLAHELHELIAALDRRAPRVEQAGEASIARDALELRAKAVRRLAELEDPNASQAPAITERPGRRARGNSG